MRNQRPDGCQLLALKKRLREEADPGERLKLKQREVKLLLALGQAPQALAAARALPPDASGLSILADVLCRRGQWKEAEATFEAARQARVREGNESRALALARGPLFLLAEAREDWSRCMALADLPVLAARAARLAGRPAEPGNSSGFPWRVVALLEACHHGGNPAGLPEALLEWGRGEPEWKWRVLFEGVNLCMSRGISVLPFRRVFRGMGGPVLDPRWPRERRAVKAALGSPARR